MAALRVLTFTSLFPSEARPRHGIFVENRLQHLRRDCDVDSRVIAPVPWFPFTAAAFGSYARFAATPRSAVRAEGLQVSYPRYLMLPRLGVARQPDSMARAAWPDVQALLDGGWRPELIDAHYLYPDGVAAGLLARRLDMPFVMTARGTDVNVIAQQPGPGRRIIEAAGRAAAVIAVSQPLKDKLVALGVEPGKVQVLRNGVDLAVFRLEDRSAARLALGLPDAGPIAACVGNLVPEKGQALAIDALCELPDVRLVIVGDGPLRSELAAQVARRGVAGRVDFRPVMPQRELSRLYAAADVLLLTSEREGWPNVVLEAMACGTPVVAFDVGAVREMVTGDAVGRVVVPRETGALTRAIAGMLATPVSREAIRAHAAQYDWTSISRGQWALFTRFAGAARGASLVAA
ncbi:MAG: glycosyltransferase [Piscinibacter sp.]|nr:glycosyltransferase [Piscinibacter sp.]